MRRQCESGRRSIFSGSPPVISTAAHSIMPAAVPETTTAPSLSVISAMRSPTARCSSSMRTKERDASSIASSTALVGRLPPSEERKSSALMYVLTFSSL